MQVNVYQSASKSDAVQIQERDGRLLNTLPYTFPLPQWEGVEEEYNLRDVAMCEALHFLGADWS